MAVAGAILAACARPPPPATFQPTITSASISRAASIPTGAVKMQTSDGAWAPSVASDWEPPFPPGPPIDTAGAEDGPSLALDGQELYFFFTPDLNVPAERQLGDGVTGIWVSHRSAASGLSEPTRVILSDPGRVALGGSEFILNDWIHLCSARAGNSRSIDLYTARRVDGMWQDWQNAGRQLNVDYGVGKLHITADGQTMYFGSSRPGGVSGRDLWRTERSAEGWSIPVNLGAPVNSTGDEDWPYVSPDGQALWFDSTSRQGPPWAGRLPQPAPARWVLGSAG